MTIKTKAYGECTIPTELYRLSANVNDPMFAQHRAAALADYRNHRENGEQEDNNDPFPAEEAKEGDYEWREGERPGEMRIIYHPRIQVRQWMITKDLRFFTRVARTQGLTALEFNAQQPLDYRNANLAADTVEWLFRFYRDQEFATTILVDNDLLQKEFNKIAWFRAARQGNLALINYLATNRLVESSSVVDGEGYNAADYAILNSRTNLMSYFNMMGLQPSSEMSPQQSTKISPPPTIYSAVNLNINFNVPVLQNMRSMAVPIAVDARNALPNLQNVVAPEAASGAVTIREGAVTVREGALNAQGAQIAPHLRTVVESGAMASGAITIPPKIEPKVAIPAPNFQFHVPCSIS